VVGALSCGRGALPAVVGHRLTDEILGISPKVLRFGCLDSFLGVQPMYKENNCQQ
jgi:hypothetical protein